MRSTAETLELDLSLRQSRTIYVTLSVINFLPSVGGIFVAFSAIAAVYESVLSAQYPNGFGSAVLAFEFGLLPIGAEYVFVAQSIEASRRLKILREHPEKNVRRLHAPFQSSVFGHFH